MIASTATKSIVCDFRTSENVIVYIDTLRCITKKDDEGIAIIAQLTNGIGFVLDDQIERDRMSTTNLNLIVV